ncbi:MAG: hypothetical protein JXD22_04900 [Sedimentisphaerales bacterium]|nr:hypothetical protein [Sedimentisphaerales bacterium]
MSNAYFFTIQTPTENITYQAGSPGTLARVLVPGILRAFPILKPSDHDIDGIAGNILVEYHKVVGSQRRRSGKGQPRIIAAGLGKDAIRCYLQRMTMAEAIIWLKENRGFNCSHSAMGRFWDDLREIELAQIYRKLPR